MASNSTSADKAVEGAKAKKDLASIMKADNDDESLKRYKEQLLGAAAKGKVGTGERLVIEEFEFDFENKSLKPQILKLGNKTEQATAASTPVEIKEGAKYRFKVKFSVNGEIVAGLKFTNIVKSSLKSQEDTLVLGSYAPGATHSFVFPRYGYMEAPSGFMFRGKYKAQMKYTDSDGKCYLDLPYMLNITK